MNAWATAEPLNWAAMVNEIRHRDGVECKVLGFFDRNPDEELAASDVVAKYGVRLDSAAAILRSLASRGLLKKRQEGRLHLYGRNS